MKQRPFAVTVLAILAGIAAVLAVFHLLQALGILPYVLGPVSIRDFNLWYVIMWGLMVWVWVWVFRALWNVEPQGWMFLVIIAIFNLIFDFVALLGATTQFADVSLSLLVNAVILLYCVLPGTKAAFGIPNA
jgi:hypothetical protein